MSLHLSHLFTSLLSSTLLLYLNSSSFSPSTSLLFFPFLSPSLSLLSSCYLSFSRLFHQLKLRSTLCHCRSRCFYCPSPPWANFFVNLFLTALSLFGTSPPRPSLCFAIFLSIPFFLSYPSSLCSAPLSLSVYFSLPFSFISPSLCLSLSLSLSFSFFPSISLFLYLSFSIYLPLPLSISLLSHSLYLSHISSLSLYLSSSNSLSFSLCLHPLIHSFSFSLSLSLSLSLHPIHSFSFSLYLTASASAAKAILGAVGFGAGEWYIHVYILNTCMHTK